MTKPKRALIWCAVSSKDQAADDKASLPAQEKAARDLCEREGWTIVDVLVVPGHSRYEVDFYELAEKAAAAGIDAFWRLRDHWIARDFDVLVVQDGDRFAREQAPIQLIISAVIKAGARIYSFNDGWIDVDSNYRFQQMMIGYRAATEVDRFVQKSQMGRNKQVEQGTYYVIRPAWSHKVERHETTGRPVRIVVDESKRPIFEAAARLVIDRVGWMYIENELYTRYGYLNLDSLQFDVQVVNGKRQRIRRTEPGRFGKQFFYALFHTPAFWGHTAKGWRTATNSRRVVEWIFDGLPPPPGTTVIRNTHEPAITGPLADDLMQEMRRRVNTNSRGKSRADALYALRGLMVCGGCGRVLTGYTVDGKYKGYRCHAPPYARCDARGRLKEQDAIAAFNTLLHAILASGDWSALEPSNAGLDQPIADLQQQIAIIDARIDSNIHAQMATATTSLKARYQSILEQDSARLDKLKEDLAKLEAQRVTVDYRAREQAAKHIVDLNVFWSNNPPGRINQILHALLGATRLVVYQSGELFWQTR
jgi:DNA invertase Pin-like site-specific DNA recombinase